MQANGHVYVLVCSNDGQQLEKGLPCQRAWGPSGSRLMSKSMKHSPEMLVYTGIKHCPLCAAGKSGM